MENLYCKQYLNMKLVINLLGGEINQFILNNVNYIHEDHMWENTAPHLFPIVGRLKNESYIYNGKTYHLKGHGFIRNSLFKVITDEENKLLIELIQTDEIKESYPFKFNYQILFTLFDKGCQSEIIITNLDSNMMYFNHGEHPGFKLFSDVSNYLIEFEKAETFTSPSVTNNKLLDFKHHFQYYKNFKKFLLNDTMFASDAVIINNVKSNKVKIISPDYELDYSFKGYPSFAFWRKVNSHFICLEPWYGYADTVESSGNLLDKVQLISLKPNSTKSFITSFKITKEYFI